MKFRLQHIAWVFVLTVAGCLEPYDPPSVKNNPDFLVVDGFVDVNTGAAQVRLTHTVPLSSTALPEAESNATVLLQDESGNSFPVIHNGAGLYHSGALPIDQTKKYRLYIRTAGNREYQSDYVQFRPTPDIDSISYFIDEFDFLNITVNTHDASGNTRYYKWHYVETYEYKSIHTTGYVLRNGAVFNRTADEFINICYRTDPATNIFVYSTQRLAEDVVSNYTLVKINPADLKITRKYSVLVEQMALSVEAFNYWSSLQKTTENLGGLFDPMPAQVLGNIRGITDPNEQVIGYFGGGEIKQKRIFIRKEDLPEQYSRFSMMCPVDTIDIEFVPSLVDPDVLIGPIYPPGALAPSGYTTSLKECLDCRRMGGGVLQKPSFWE